MCKTSLYFFESDFYFYADSNSTYCTQIKINNAIPVLKMCVFVSCFFFFIFDAVRSGQSEKNSLNCYVLSNPTCAQQIEKCIRHSIAIGNRKMRFDVMETKQNISRFLISHIPNIKLKKIVFFYFIFVVCLFVFRCSVSVRISCNTSATHPLGK